eukprot:750942-Hanusia_phi.AAC.12
MSVGKFLAVKTREERLRLSDGDEGIRVRFRLSTACPCLFHVIIPSIMIEAYASPFMNLQAMLNEAALCPDSAASSNISLERSWNPIHGSCTR